MLSLPAVTLCCIDTVNHRLAARALARSTRAVEFARTLFLTAGFPGDVALPPATEVVAIEPLRSRAAYSQFVLKRLSAHITTPHVLLMQWDGYVVNPDAWSPDFLACDYLGAKWYWHEDGMRVGNGGFSLRSKRLLQALQDPRIVPGDAEDVTIGRIFRPLLESDYGIRFGDEALADRFSFEAAYPIGRPFGFHGLFNFCRVEPVQEIAGLAPLLSDAIARSPQIAQLVRNCAALGQWAAVLALANRVLAADPTAMEAASLAQRARAELSRPANVGRNDPCPCGSGRKYKQCHGALTAGAATGASSDVDALVATGLAAHQKGELAAAEAAYRSALSVHPEHPMAMHYLGVIHYQQQRWAQALPLLERSAAAVPSEPEFHNNLGLALAATDRNEEAIAAYRRTIALKPDHAVAWNNLGLVLTATNRLAEAAAAFREAIARVPDFGQAHWNLALALLGSGHFEEGWREYEWRLRLIELGAHAVRPAAPRWDGRMVPGKTLLLTAEQGLGDAIQFARFAARVASEGMRLELQAPRVLQRLLATVPGVSRVHASEDSPPPCDFHLALLSLPGVLGIDASAVTTPIPYVQANAELRAQSRAALAPYRALRRIGVVWAGNPHHGNDRRRSIPAPMLLPLFGAPETAWFSLQKDVSVGPPLIEWPARNDMDELAALIAELDLVVCVDTSIAHLAGALGLPTWLLLPFAPDWRWGLAGSDSPWYPTMRIFRQQRPGDWASVIAAVGSALAGTDSP